MRVLIMNDLGTPTGGAELMTLAISEAMRQRGHETLTLTSDAGNHPDKFSDVRFFGSTSAFGTLLKVANPFAVRCLRQTLTSFKPDVVHVRMFMTQLSPLILRTLRDVPTLYHAVSHEVLCPTVNKILPDGTLCEHSPGLVCRKMRCLSLPAWGAAMIERNLLMRWKNEFDVVVANGTVLAEKLEAMGMPDIRVVNNGVQALPKRPPLSSPPTITFAGRLVLVKGIDILLKTFQSVQSVVEDAKLLIIGDGPLKSDLKKMAAELSLRNVSWLGQMKQQQVSELCANSWIHAVPSRAETFGISATEAMMRGSAVVASRVGGLIDQVENGTTGFFCPVDDADAFASVMIPLLQDRERCEQMGAAARQRALDIFTIDRCAERFEQIYQEMCMKPKNNEEITSE